MPRCSNSMRTFSETMGTLNNAWLWAL